MPNEQFNGLETDNTGFLPDIEEAFATAAEHKKRPVKVTLPQGLPITSSHNCTLLNKHWVDSLDFEYSSSALVWC